MIIGHKPEKYQHEWFNQKKRKIEKEYLKIELHEVILQNSMEEVSSGMKQTIVENIMEE